MTTRLIFALLVCVLLSCAAHAQTVAVQTKDEFVALERLAAAVRSTGKLHGFYAGTISVPDISGECTVTPRETTAAQEVTVLAGFNDSAVMAAVLTAICGGDILPLQAKRWGSRALGTRYAAARCETGDQFAFVVILGLVAEGVDP